MLTLCCSWAWEKSANTWHTAAGWAPHNHRHCILGRRVLEGHKLAKVTAPSWQRGEKLFRLTIQFRFHVGSTRTDIHCKSAFSCFVRDLRKKKKQAEYMTHHCIPQWGQYPSASRPIWPADDARDVAALRCHKSPETTPLAPLWHNRQNERGQDRRSVPGGRHWCSTWTSMQVSRYQDVTGRKSRPSSVLSLFWDGVSWIFRVHSPAAGSPQQWVVMNSQFWNPSVESSRGLNHNIT